MIALGKHSSNLSAPPLDMVDVGNEGSVDEEKKKETKFNNYKLRRKKSVQILLKTLAYINFNAPNCYLLTLTFDERKSSKCKDLDYCHRCFKNICMNYESCMMICFILGYSQNKRMETGITMSSLIFLKILPLNSKKLEIYGKRGIAHTRTLYDWDDFFLQG